MQTWINRLKKQLDTVENKQLLSNFFSLGLLQATNVLLPLIIVPYLIRTIGIEKFGLVSFAQATMSYFIVISDYGFNLSATKDITINKSNPKEISNVFTSVLATKGILAIIGLLILTAAIFLFRSYIPDPKLYYFSFFMVIGQVILPVWFFQGIQQMQYLTVFNTISKVLFTVFIFIFINQADDYIYVNFILGMGSVLAGVISLFIVRLKFNVLFRRLSFNSIFFQLKQGWNIFISSFAINIYMSSNVLILGFFSSAIIVGYYSIAEKIMLAIRQLLAIFSQVIYPRVCNLAQNNHQRLREFFKKIFIPFLFFIFLCCLLLFIFSSHIVVLFNGEPNSEIARLIKILSFIPFIVAINIPAYQTLVVYNFKWSYTWVLITGSLINIIANATLAYYFAAYGTASALVITELFITLSLYIVLETRHMEYSLLKIKL